MGTWSASGPVRRPPVVTIADWHWRSDSVPVSDAGHDLGPIRWPGVIRIRIERWCWPVSVCHGQSTAPRPLRCPCPVIIGIARDAGADIAMFINKNLFHRPYQSKERFMRHNCLVSAWPLFQDMRRRPGGSCRCHKDGCDFLRCSEQAPCPARQTFTQHAMRLNRLCLRVPNGAEEEFLLAATAPILRKLAILRPADATTRVKRRVGSDEPTSEALTAPNSSTESTHFGFTDAINGRAIPKAPGYLQKKKSEKSSSSFPKYPGG